MSGKWFTPEDVVAIVMGERNVVLEYYGSDWTRYDFYFRLQNAMEFDARAIGEALRRKAKQLDPGASPTNRPMSALDAEMALEQDLDLGRHPKEVAANLMDLADAIERHYDTIAKAFEEKASQCAAKIGI